MPTVSDLTEQVLSGRDVTSHAGTYLVSRGGDTPDRLPPDAPVIRFASVLAGLVNSFEYRYGDGREANYEDIAFLAAQIHDCLGREYENPALLHLLDYLVRTETTVDNANELDSLASEENKYLQGTVWSSLLLQPKRLDHLGALIDAVEALRDDQVVWLTSLNHDTVLEQAFSLHGVAFTDGFEERIGDLAYGWTDTYTGNVRLLKPHGSLNWLRTRHRGRRVWVRAAEGADMYHLYADDGELLEFPADGLGQFLTGTFNKILSYQGYVYAEQHVHFFQALKEADTLDI